jgi:hypothetical protein
MAPLIMVTLPSVSSFSNCGRVSTSSSTCGCFHGVEWSFSRMISLLSFVSSLWTSSLANGSIYEWRRPHVLRVASSSRSRNEGPTSLRNGPGQPAWADRTRPIQGRFGGPFAPVGPFDILHFAPSIASFLRCYPPVQDRGSSRMKSGLLHFNPQGCSFVTLWSLPPLGVISSCTWTRTGLLICSFELVVTPSFLSKHNTSKCICEDELVISLVCLVAG